MGSLRRTVLQPFVILPLVALLALGGWFLFRPTDDAPAATAVATSQTVEATTGTMARTVSAEGTVAAAQAEDLSFASAGTVTAVNVEAGDTVAAGQVLATIDSAELEAALADAEASLADAEAALADDTEAGASDAQLEADESTVASAQDQVDNARDALEGASLTASFAGTVATVDLTVGEELGSSGTGGVTATGTASGSGRSAGTLGSSGAVVGIGGGEASTDTAEVAQVQVVSSGLYTVELGFDATDVAELAVGQDAIVTLSTSTSSSSGFPGGGFPGAGGFPGGPGSTGAGAEGAAPDPADEEADGSAAAAEAPGAAVEGVRGTVFSVGEVADASSGVASYPVSVLVSDTSGDLDAGATVSVEITYAEVTDVVQVPVRAVTTADGASTVTVSVDGEEEERTVTTGLTSGSMVEISSGLDAGEQVVVGIPGRAGGTGTGTGGGSGQFTPPEGFDPSQLPGGAPTGAGE